MPLPCNAVCKHGQNKHGYTKHGYNTQTPGCLALHAFVCCAYGVCVRVCVCTRAKSVCVTV